ncbi:hypothetical protein SAMN05192564_102649 [Paraburkholderia sartisoli]|uniref:Uncharacterized protein n=1 Tax=Paraburkholderia sartisoli TaxID=83784 RepID=A0A1H4D4W4_9BURK|nr:hypothetical protein SAMN05192564_102649 [Paraburkholderia sartisoli]
MDWTRLDGQKSWEGIDEELSLTATITSLGKVTLVVRTGADDGDYTAGSGAKTRSGSSRSHRGRHSLLVLDLTAWMPVPIRFGATSDRQAFCCVQVRGCGAIVDDPGQSAERPIWPDSALGSTISPLRRLPEARIGAQLRLQMAVSPAPWALPLRPIRRTLHRAPVQAVGHSGKTVGGALCAKRMSLIHRSSVRVTHAPPMKSIKIQRAKGAFSPVSGCNSVAPSSRDKSHASEGALRQQTSKRHSLSKTVCISLRLTTTCLKPQGTRQRSARLDAIIDA